MKVPTRYKTPNINFWLPLVGKFVTIVFLVGNALNLQGQELPESYRKTIDSLIGAMPKTYNEIDEALNASRADTIRMRYFAERSEAKNYYEGQSYALNQIGRKYRDISRFSKSFILHQKAFDAAEKANSQEFEIFSLNMISVVFRRTDAIKAALDYSQKALELAESVKNPSEGIKRSINVSLNGIGNIYLTLGQYDLAIEQFKKSMKLEEALGNKLGLAINNQNIGECYEKLGRLDDALNSFRTSLAYNEEIDSDKGRVICNNSIAQVYIKKGDSKQAVEILEPILVQAEALEDKDIISLIQINLGWALMNLKRYGEAENHLNKGLEMAKIFNIPSNISTGNDFLSELYSLKGDYKKALEYFKNARHFEDEIASDRNIRYVNDMITRYDSEKKSAQLEMMSKENEIVKLKLRKNNATLLISGIILALLAGIFYVLYRQYQLKNEKKLLTLEQSMLRSQMNPHFLFNSLNSIKLYIINNEKKNAVHYLNKFSKLVRKILEASSLKEIPLEEELETVELYMNIENIRFSNEINFKVIIDKDIDVHAIKIPSLILQPFLENALWHGLSSKEGEKNIELEVSRGIDGFINISITDNGVGREASEKIKESKVLKRKSIGIDITKERLANFSRDYLNSFNVQILDLYDEDHRPMGTKVILHIPTI
jgi:tetratricopeptide (TPR) repeat protein